ncbi:MAG: uridine kinase [Lachnospiraceae bacterium]|nr:uridine kinase [Lachnospiraceae bacterium]MDD7024525.1 uridine kinase [Oscillospiraceae bacterium]MDY5540081.1 uridine kinase [Lachnospiraceae bacterium]
MDKVWVIGIAGGTASGKTTIVNRLKEYFKDDISLVGHDSYYLAHDEMPFEERSRLNYDHPASFETNRMIADIRKLKEGMAVDCPVYDFTIHNRSDRTVRIEPRPVIIVEGILILENEELRKLMDIKIFVDTDADERITRRLIRDMQERGRSAQSVVDQYIATVKPMHEKYVEPSKKYADIIIPRGGENEIAIRMLIEHLKVIMGRKTETGI